MAMTGAGGHLLHVGYPKTGSKFLQRWFEAHPDIAFSHWGIAGFRNAHALTAAAAGRPLPDWMATSHEALLTPMAELEDLGARARGIELPTRLSQHTACAMLAGLFPTAKVLIVTRAYEPLIRSFYAELVTGGAGYSFNDFCEALLVQVDAGTDVFHFDAAIDSYAARFGPERLLVLPYELLRDRPDAFFGGIEAWLGIRTSRIPNQRVRPSPPAARLAAYRRMTRWVRAIPGPQGLRTRAVRLYIAALRSGRVAGLADAIGGRGGGDTMPRRLIEALRGRSERLRGNPLYRDYSRDYLM
jgi:hypothetical protein